MIAMGGPTVSYGVSVAKALGLWNKGEFERGVEKITPAFLRQFMVAGRYATEGVKTNAGKTVFEPSEISALDIAAQAIGFAPHQIVEQIKDNIARKGIDITIERERNRLLEELYRAKEEDDFSDEDKIMDRIDDFNDKYPSSRLSRDTIQKSMAVRKKDDAATDRGLLISKGRRAILMPERE
jgi:hypothetical protein